mmetsp:Transcript_11272/g.17212  ORF Transcript_11272/g.17212 Transcript_11272/m.17212 type:complete len:321 (-) Transcript_11272:79-1041(-)
MPTPASRRQQQLTIKQIIVFIGPFFLAFFYTISIRRTTHPSIVDNGIKYDTSTQQIITTQQHYKNPTIIMSDLDHDYTTDDYRAFLFAQHPIHGLLLLYCSRKKNKPPHFQAPGGHVDKEDFNEALTRLQDTTSSSGVDLESSHPLLLLACKIGAARELYEETGIDLRNHLDRLQPVQLRKSEKDNGLFTTSCVLKHRLFFKICVTDDDFETKGFDYMVALGLSQSMNTEAPMLMLKLSEEHQGFRFEPDPRRAVDLLTQHSGGKVSKALGMALAQGEINDVVMSSERDEPDLVIGHPMKNEAKDHTETEKGVKDCFHCC